MKRHSRRAFLAGAVATLAMPAVRTHAARRRVAHLITAFDDSTSMYYLTLSLAGLSTVTMPPLRRVPYLQDWSEAMRNAMWEIIRKSGYDEVIFEAFGWSQYTRPLVARIRLVKGECQPELETIADTLLADTSRIETIEEFGGTDIRVAFREGLPRFDTPVDRRVLNIVSDDDEHRILPHQIDAFRKAAIKSRITINALVLGDENAMDGYFYTVATGRVLRGTGPEVWARKFEADLS